MNKVSTYQNALYCYINATYAFIRPQGFSGKNTKKYGNYPTLIKFITLILVDFSSTELNCM